MSVWGVSVNCFIILSMVISVHAKKDFGPYEWIYFDIFLVFVMHGQNRGRETMRQRKRERARERERMVLNAEMSAT